MVDQPFGAAVPSVPLSRSPLAFVVAQIRFPLVTSISDESFIGPFQEQLRSTYGDLRREDETQVLVGPDGVHNVRGGVVWRFSDGPDGWEVALTPEFVALATGNYTNRDRIQEESNLVRLSELLRLEVVGPYNVPSPEAVKLNNVLTDCDYAFSDDSLLRARWGFLGARTTFDPALAPVDTPSWVLDLDASHGERDFDISTILDQVQLFSDRIYRYFRWVVTDEFLTTYGANT